MAKAHVAAHGGKWHVVDRKSPSWRAWVAYRPSLAIFETITVPTEWPLEFDASAPAAPPPELARPSISPERRRELAQILMALVAGAQAKARAAWRSMTKPQAEDRLDELKREYAGPITASAELARMADRYRDVEF